MHGMIPLDKAQPQKNATYSAEVIVAPWVQQSRGQEGDSIGVGKLHILIWIVITQVYV